MNPPAMRSFSLEFEDPALENAFRREYRELAVGYYRMLVLALLGFLLIVSASGFVMTFSVNREGIQALLWLALIPITALAAVLLHMARPVKRLQAIVATYVAAIAVVCVGYPVLRGDRLILESYGFSYAAFLLFLALAFARFSPAMSLLLIAAVIGAYGVAVGVAAGLSTAINHAPLLLGASALGFAVGYLAERGTRQLFAARSIIEDRERRLVASEASLREAQRRSEELILSMLPAAIAERLKAQPGTTIADGIAECTVVFADLVGFTSLARETGPRALVSLLNRLFSEFDALGDRHGLEKIKTIGDAYMTAAGIPEYVEDHAVRAADLALAMQRCVRDFNAANGCDLQLRIGIHSGPVIAGVIGRRKFAYDLWGETVNTASRLESHGLPGRIQLSETTALLLKRTHVVEERGVIELKGRGPMPTCWLVARRESQADAHR